VNIELGKQEMSIDKIILAVAGTVVLTTTLLVLTNTIPQVWLWVTAFVGFNLLQSAFTGFCPLAMILKQFGLKTNCESGCK
jgi:hypothetical protein